MTNQWHGNLQREFRIRERVALQLRSALLNRQNRSQFAVPDPSPYSTSFGKIVQQTNATNRFALVQARVCV